MSTDPRDLAAEARSDRIAVVGGGPAGLAAAEVLAGAGRPVTVYERMPSVGRRLLMAGRGGLNITHGEPLPAFLGRYHPVGSLEAAIRAFPPQSLCEWCEGLGQATFVGSSGRVFPETFKASPLLRAWLARLEALGVAIRTRHRLLDIAGLDVVFETPDGPVREAPAAVLLALGGASWPRLGADGSWVPLLEGLGAPVSPLRPANVGFRVAWSTHFRARFAGEPVKRIGLAAGGRSVRGEMMVTETGLEGGAVYALSRILREAAEADGTADLVLDLRPDLDEAALARRLASARPGESAANRLRKGAGLAPVAAGLLRESTGGPLPAAPAALAARIKTAHIRLDGPEPIARAISTAGGLHGLDARFMLTSRPGLFAAGEMLDWEAPTGGYLLQGAIASGRAAAAGMLAWLAETAGGGP